MKKLILFLLIILIVFISGCTNLSKPSEEYKYCSEDQHHGLSTNGTCSSDNDCSVGGCNSEICQSKSEEPMVSICVYDPPYPKDLDCSCRCLDNKCMWAK